MLLTPLTHDAWNIPLEYLQKCFSVGTVFVLIDPTCIFSLFPFLNHSPLPLSWTPSFSPPPSLPLSILLPPSLYTYPFFPLPFSLPNPLPPSLPPSLPSSLPPFLLTPHRASLEGCPLHDCGSNVLQGV